MANHLNKTKIALCLIILFLGISALTSCNDDYNSDNLEIQFSETYPDLSIYIFTSGSDDKLIEKKSISLKNLFFLNTGTYQLKVIRLRDEAYYPDQTFQIREGKKTTITYDAHNTPHVKYN